MPSFGFLILTWCIAFYWAPVTCTNGTESHQSNRKDVLEENPATLEEEIDHQENILTKLLGDYDKVKALSEGPDCRCKCVVRPLSRSACMRIEEGSARAEDYYTVETVTSGSNCTKCACIAPPSALNPCEGDLRFKKLQEAGEQDVKISTIMELLEGAFYGMDLLKLQSVTTKLLQRVESIEKSISGNVSKERASVRDVPSEKGKASHANHRLEKKKRLGELQPTLQKNVAAAYTHTEKKYEERFVGSQSPGKPLLKRSHSAGQEEQPVKAKNKEEGSAVKVIKGVTYYKANTEDDGKAEDLDLAYEASLGDGSIDLLIEDHLPRQQHVSTPAPDPLTTTAAPALKMDSNSPSQPPATTPKQSVLKSQAAKRKVTTTTTLATLAKTSSATVQPVASSEAASSSTPAAVTKQPASPTVPQVLAANTQKLKTRLVWDESPTPVSRAASKNPGECKDTLASIADPVTHNSYGGVEGAWMKDPKGNGKVIYVTKDDYGDKLLEFRDMDAFKQDQSANSYKLPFNWIGTGHVVYGGAFFYNRAFSRDIIKFDLRLRYVAAWTTLHDAVFEEETLAHSDIDFAVDESGLWMIYPAVDEEGFHQEVVILSKLNPYDLQKQRSWRTGLRRHFYGNSFIICGVLYAVDSYDRAHANISYAFDTHTHTQMIPGLPFTSNYTYTTQIDYNPKDRMLYAWDNGHQVTYDVIFAY